MTLTEDDLNKEFSFKLTLKDSNNQEFTKTLKMVKVINGIAQVPTDIASNSVLKLKGGESLRLYGLPIGTKYTIEELPAEGYVLVNDSSEGVIGVNTELIHKFRNTKKGMDAAQIQGYKRLSNTEGSNRVLKENDFQFVLEPVKATVEKKKQIKTKQTKKKIQKLLQYKHQIIQQPLKVQELMMELWKKQEQIWILQMQINQVLKQVQVLIVQIRKLMVPKIRTPISLQLSLNAELI